MDVFMKVKLLIPVIDNNGAFNTDDVNRNPTLLRLKLADVDVDTTSNNVLANVVDKILNLTNVIFVLVVCPTV
jgi:hypothetical protein